MTTDGAPKSLSEITKDIGLNMSDVAMFSGLDESTICRLWDNDAWLDRVSGRSLQRLISSVPGVAEYSMRHSLQKRRDMLVTDLGAEGLAVDLEAFEKTGIAQQLLLNSLDAAVQIMRGKASQKVSSYLARFWGQEGDGALSALYSPERGEGLLENPQRLYELSLDLAPRLNRKTYSFHSIIALNILTHQVSKWTGTVDAEVIAPNPGRQSAFMMRGVVMGSLISTNDLEIAEKYQRELAEVPVYSALEEWSFPTYTHDCRTTSDFTLPSSLYLRNTAQEVLREIATYNDAYLYYLVSTYIPLALTRDPTFGSRIAELMAALENREADCRDKKIREACGMLVRQLKGMAA